MAAPMGPEIALINARLEGKPVFPTLRRLRSRPPIVLVSRERDFAPEAFEIRALDYLLIPFGPRRFAHAMQRAILQARRRREKLSRNQEFGLLLYRAGEFNLVPFERIQYLQSENKGTLVEADGKQFESRKYLAELGRRLPSRMFQRIHRQYIVNVSQIARIRSVSGGRYALSLRDNAERSTLPVGARYARELISLLKA
jgi:DNA-binding LytR/AlgR family response regulator